jgi:hypothetical protein
MGCWRAPVALCSRVGRRVRQAGVTRQNRKLASTRRVLLVAEKRVGRVSPVEWTLCSAASLCSALIRLGLRHYFTEKGRPPGRGTPPAFAPACTLDWSNSSLMSPCLGTCPRDVREGVGDTNARNVRQDVYEGPLPRHTTSVFVGHGAIMRKRPTSREGRRRLVELRAILKIRSIRKAERIAAQVEVDALAPIVLHTPKTWD